MNLIQTLASGTYGANGLSAASACSAVAILTVGLGIFTRTRRSGGGAAFLAIACTCTAWLGSFGFMYAAQDPRVALEWARIGDFAIALLAPAMLQFSVVYVGRVEEYRRRVVASWAICATLGGAGFLPFFVPSVHRYAWGYYPSATLPGVIALLIYIAVVVAAITVLRQAYYAAEGKARERANALIIAFIALSLAAFDFLPATGIDVVPIAHILVLLFVIIAAAALWRFQLVDLTPEFAASQILGTMKSAVLVVDMTGRIRVVNTAACAMLGYEEAELVGMHIRTVLAEDETTTTGRILMRNGIVEQTTTWRSADGSPVDVLTSSSYVRTDRGVALAAIYVASDYRELKRAEQALRASEYRYRTLFEHNPLPMWIYDFDTLKFTDVNDAAIAHYGYTRDEFLSMRITDIRPQEDVNGILTYIQHLHPRQGPAVSRHLKKDGAIIDTEVTSFEFGEKGRRSRLVISQDVTERRRADEELRRSEERYRLLFERNLAGVYRTTINGRVLDCNDALARIFGYGNRDELLGESGVSVYFDATERQRIVQILREQKTLSNLEVRMRRRDGSAVWVLENVSLLEGDVLEGTIIDITDRKTAQERVEFQAYHDVLTGLPNRRLFRDRITVALAHAVRNARCAAVMFLDLDQFKVVNDTLGHTTGDALLQEVATRLVGCMRADDTVARMGGDEFTILMGDITERRAPATVAQKVIEAMRQPFDIEGHELVITSSIGIAMFPDDGADAEALLKQADRAMYQAKELGRNNYQYATPAAFDKAEGRIALERSLEEAVDKGELVVHYQPIVEIASGRVVGAEALVRWDHPADGLLQPSEFLSVAEQSNLIVPLGEWVLRKACRQLKQWHDAGHLALRVSVNLSLRQLQHRDLVETIERVLAETGLPPAALDIEITESAAMQNAELAVTVLTWLKNLGVRISIDDFGKGYSSVTYLKRLPVDTVKIHQGLIRGLTTDQRDAAIIFAMISIARALRLSVVAEGVETPEQLALLRENDCDLAQGYLHSRPLPADEFERELLISAVLPPADEPRLQP